MLKSINNFLYSILNYILPERINFILTKNLSENDIINLPRAVPIDGMDWIYPIFHYKYNNVRAIIWELKYKDNTILLEYIGKIMHEEILSHIGDIIIFDGNAEFLLIPIPITEEKRIERGYNQSEYIAKNILENDVGHIMIYAPQWFSKIKNTPKQSTIQTREERLSNLTNSFEAKLGVRGKYIILIDDVVTTGSTLFEARKTLLSAGAKDILAFTIAH